MQLLGQQTPRFESAPESWTTAAAREVADLMKSLGQPGDPWQQHVWELWLGERRDGTWSAFECACFVQRQNGKGGLTEGRELGGLFLFGEKKIIHTAHRLDTAMEAFNRVANLVDGSDDLTRRVKSINRTHSQEAIELMGGAVLQFRTRIEGGGRGLAGCECLVLDEALKLKAAHMDALAPTMLAAPNAQVIYTSTPPEDEDAHIIEVRDRGRAGSPRLAYAEWSNEPGVDVDDPRVRAAANPAYGIRISDERMDDLKPLLGAAGFARECIGIWPRTRRDRWLVIREADWLAALVAEARFVHPVGLAVDVTPDGSAAAIGAGGSRLGGGRLVEVLDFRPGTAWVVPRLKELQAHRPLAIAVNDRAVADQAEQAGLHIHRVSVGDLVSACGLFFAGVADPDLAARDVAHLPDDDLDEAVAGATKRDLGGAWAWDRRVVTTVICPLVAVSLGLWVAATPRVHRARRAAAFAAVDTSASAGRRQGGPAPVDVAQARVAEQLARDLARRS